MSKIVAATTITNPFDDKSVTHPLLVDIGTSALILPASWKNRLGPFIRSDTIELQRKSQEPICGEVCGPIEVRIHGFRPVCNEVIFLESEEADEDPDPLLGYLILEQAQAAVDMLGHRLVPVQYIDMK